MNILRLSTLSLTLAIAFVTLGYMDSASADPKNCGGDHCVDHGGGGAEPSSFTYTVRLIGPSTGVRGAFEFKDNPAVSATLDSKGLSLTGDDPVTMQRAGMNLDCSGMADPDATACFDWNMLFNLCGLLGPNTDPSTTKLDKFTVDPGDWSVAQGGGKRSIGFGFAIPPAQSNGTDRDLSAALTLSGPCVDADIDPTCESDPSPLFPTEAGPANATETVVNHASIHLRGKAGVTHKAACHARDLDLMRGSRVVIEATAAG